MNMGCILIFLKKFKIHTLVKYNIQVLQNASNVSDHGLKDPRTHRTSCKLFFITKHYFLFNIKLDTKNIFFNIRLDIKNIFLNYIDYIMDIHSYVIFILQLSFSLKAINIRTLSMYYC